MATKPTQDPKWVTSDDPNEIIEPSPALKTNGVQSGGIWGREHLNWMFNSLSKWIDWVRSYAMDKDNNLNDVADKPSAFNNIKQGATTSSTGVVEKATTEEMTTGVSDKFPDCSTVKGYIGRSANTTILNRLGEYYGLDNETAVDPSFSLLTFNENTLFTVGWVGSGANIELDNIPVGAKAVDFQINVNYSDVGDYLVEGSVKVSKNGALSHVRRFGWGFRNANTANKIVDYETAGNLIMVLDNTGKGRMVWEDSFGYNLLSINALAVGVYI